MTERNPTLDKIVMGSVVSITVGYFAFIGYVWYQQKTYHKAAMERLETLGTETPPDEITETPPDEINTM